MVKKTSRELFQEYHRAIKERISEENKQQYELDRKRELIKLAKKEGWIK
jgi:ribosomal protein S17E